MSTRRNPSGLRDPKLSVVIPVYNEKATIDEILRRVIEAPMRKEIILVDDCSRDRTLERMQALALADPLPHGRASGRGCLGHVLRFFGDDEQVAVEELPDFQQETRGARHSKTAEQCRQRRRRDYQ